MRQRAERAESQVRDLAEARSTLESTIAEERQLVGRLGERIAELEGDIEARKVSMAEMEKQIAAQGEVVDRINGELAAAKKKLGLQSRSILDVRGKARDAEKKLAACEKQLENANSQLSAFRGKAESAKGKEAALERLTKEHELLAKERNFLSKERERLVDELASARQAVREQDGLRKRLDEAKVALDKSQTALEKSRAAAEATTASFKAKLGELHAQLETRSEEMTRDDGALKVAQETAVQMTNVAARALRRCVGDRMIAPLRVAWRDAALEAEDLPGLAETLTARLAAAGLGTGVDICDDGDTVVVKVALASTHDALGDAYSSYLADSIAAAASNVVDRELRMVRLPTVDSGHVSVELRSTGKNLAG
jgi:hypothetical protein